MRMTEEEFAELMKGRRGVPTVPKADKKQPKYRNQKTEAIDPKTGEKIIFDSKKECDFYFELLAREKAGEVYDIKRQVEFILQEAFTDITGKKQRAITYKADFVYKERVNPKRAGKIVTSDDIIPHVVDVKGVRTDVYKLKKKMLAYTGVIIEEV